MLGWIDIGIVGIYIAYSALAGFGSARAASHNLEEYYLAGRTLKGWQAGISMAATQFAADTPLTVAGLIATAGIFSMWRFWIYALAFLLMALVLGPSWRRVGVITDAALTEVRYGGRSAAVLRGAKAVYFGLVFNCVVLAMVLHATTRITEPFLLWHEWIASGLHDWVRAGVEALGFPLTASGTPCQASGVCAAGFECLRSRCIGHAQWVASTNNVLSIAAIVGVTTLYSTTGGLRAVVKTDIAQFAIAMAATLAYAVVIVKAAGGLSELHVSLQALYPADGSGPLGLSSDNLLAFTPGEAAEVSATFLGVLLLQWICQVNADGSGYLAQRTMACRSDGDARTAGVVFAVAQVLLRSLLWLPIGIGLLVLFPASGNLSGSALVDRREASYVAGIAELLPPGLMGLMVTGMLGALASTVDTHLNWGSSYFTNDIYRRFIARHLLAREPSPRSLVWVARGTNGLILLIALAIMPTLDTIRQAWETSLLFGAGVGVVLVLRWLWWRMNAIGELTTLVSAMLLVPVVMLTFTDGATRFLLMALVPPALGVTAALSTKPEPAHLLAEFYRRARPPGFWRPQASAYGQARADRRRLYANLLATFGSGFSIFALLTGAGTWLMDGTPPTWLPLRSAWIALNLGLGLGTIPLWMRVAKRGRLVDLEAPTPEQPRPASQR